MLQQLQDKVDEFCDEDRTQAKLSDHWRRNNKLVRQTAFELRRRGAFILDGQKSAAQKKLDTIVPASAITPLENEFKFCEFLAKYLRLRESANEAELDRALAQELGDGGQFEQQAFGPAETVSLMTGKSA